MSSIISSSSSASKVEKKWDWVKCPFKTNKNIMKSSKSNAAKMALKKQESDRSVTSFLSSTSVATESPFSLCCSSPGKEIKLTVKPVAPNLDDSHSSSDFVVTEQHEVEVEPNPRIELKKQVYQDAPSSPTDSISTYGYGYEEEDSAPGNTARENISPMGTPPPRLASLSIETTPPQRSSLKKVGSPRRTSIRSCGEIETVLPSSNGQKVRRRTSIQFNGKVKVKTIPNIITMDDVQPETLWFQSDEYDKMKQKCYDIVEKVDNGETAGKKYCTRGLENLSITSESRRRKMDAWDTVLDEQDRQWDNGQADEEYIAKMYKFTTILNQKEATLRAKQDQVEVEAYLKSSRKACRRFSIA